MSDLLTLEEYQAIAAELNPAAMSFVDGGFRPALSGNTFETINPANGETLAQVAACNAQDVDFAFVPAGRLYPPFVIFGREWGL